MHDCETCGIACACDGEDAYGAPQPKNCRHRCDEDDDKCGQCHGTGQFTYSAGMRMACDNCGGTGAEP